MILIRRFEERAEMLYQKGNKIGGFFHQYSGQEPVAVGSIGVLREDDYVITAYRDHGHALALGMTARAGMAELLGKATGCSRGKGGSMHFFDVEKGMMGGHAIVGSHIPLAAGFAFASKYRGEDRVAICYLGDGAINQGSVHEALNMAALWKLPVIYVVENNLYAMGTSLARSSAVPDLTVRCAVPYGIPGFAINGNDIELMAKTTREAANRARAGEGPTFIEAVSYRAAPHATADDPTAYIDLERVEEEKRNECLGRYERYLQRAGVLTDELAEEIRNEALEEMRAGIAAAEAEAPADPELIFANAYVDPPPSLRDG
jgi:pyruvate dehydrogenase E1 component alpha subunit